MLIVTELIGKYLMTVDGVANYYTESILRQASYDEGGLRGLYVRGFHPSAPVIFLFHWNPAWLESGSVVGTTHGSPYTYDTHVPVFVLRLRYQKGIVHAISSHNGYCADNFGFVKNKIP